jgi:hypothetical protein
MGRAASETLSLNKAGFVQIGKDQAGLRLSANLIPAGANYALLLKPDADQSGLLPVNSPSDVRPRTRFTPISTPRAALTEAVYNAFHRIGVVLAKRSADFPKPAARKNPISASSLPQHSTLASDSSIPAHLDLSRYRDLCLHEQSPQESQDVQQLADEFRTMRKNKSLSRTETATLLQCSVEQIGILENGYGNLETAQSLFFRLRHLHD